ncbi:MAG TPA: hypothetical protein VHM02_15250 [Thermoanaerobaculia bacterium]|nr:hypothetical protein [Thermoanaerobaculia bacterium]
MSEVKRPDARKVFEILQRSELVNLDVPVRQLADSVSKLEEVAGYVIAWEKYVLVVASELAQVSNPATRG